MLTKSKVRDWEMKENKEGLEKNRKREVREGGMKEYGEGLKKQEIAW